MSRFFKKLNIVSDDIMFMAKLDDDKVLFISDDYIDDNDEPNDTYGSYKYLMDNDYIESNEQEFVRFLKQTTIYKRMKKIQEQNIIDIMKSDEELGIYDS